MEKRTFALLNDKKRTMGALGNHILVEFMRCDPHVLNDVSSIERDMVEAARKAGATVINSTFHHFSPYGVSGVVVIEESHLAIHTWPEYGYAAVDLFTCGEMDAWISFDFLKEAFRSDSYSAIEMKRGSKNLLKRIDFDISSSRQKADEWVNPGMYTRNVWFTDKDEFQALSLRYTGEVYHDVTTAYQRVRILESPKYGKFLALDDMVMTTENDEFHYHEMISHPAIFAHGNVKNVLVIGGGDGGTVREVLRHSGIEKVTMVEIDGEVIKACKQHLPDIAAAFDDPRLELIVGDGISFAEQATHSSYDLIIVDGSDPVGPAEGLFSVGFYNNCYKALKPDGILVAQGESPKFNEAAFTDLHDTIEGLFGKGNAYVSLFYVPTYPTGMWSFQVGTKASATDFGHIDAAEVEAFVQAKGLKYYNSSIHTASLALPNFVRQLLQRK
ncbi:polyamine aminopropyltransferase [Nitritalea halalkaliphila]|uniref:polyamine aminopropyltransferase n=1 Tax=Nitritalea halalkaliphila TaxID=590849 RepID=UPI001EE66C69|nr:polyamine aminopropyltransferase [Nitritalea halalkaliphila]